MATITVMEFCTAVGCPVGCHYCPQGVLAQAYRGDKLMSLADFQLFMTKLAPGTSVCFSGFVEPFVNRKCADMVLHAYGLGFPVSVYTTLTGLTLDRWERLKHVEFRHFDIHLPDAEGRAKIAVTHEYLELLRRVATERRRWCASDFGVSHGKLHPEARRVLESVPGWKFGEFSPHDRAGLVSHAPHQFKLGPVRCANNEKLDRNVVMPDGTVVLCCQDFGLRHPLGNLRFNTHQEILAGQPLADVRKAMRSHSDLVACRFCNFSERCS